MRRTAIRAVLALVVVGVLIAMLSAGSNPYRVRLQLSDAQGLRDGAKVVIGGVQVGTVHLALGRHSRLLATLDIDRSHAPVGRNASATIAAVNLLGQKEVELVPGSRHDPAPSGWTIPASRITPSTDLDQVLDVLGPDTRARLTVLINELGAAVTGRRADFSNLLEELPTSLTQGTTLLDQIVADHGTLADLVAKSDRFVTTLADQRRALGELVGSFSQTAGTISARDADLRRTIAELPATLASARGFLDRLRATTVPLGPAASDIERVVPSLSSVLNELEPFTAAARPALAKATAVAPELTTLANGATPALAQAQAPLSTLARVSSDLIPVTDALNKSVDNLIAIPSNWAHAIELRDGLSHVFRAEVTVTPQTLKWMVDRLLNSNPSSSSAARRTSRHVARPRASSATAPVHTTSSPASPSAAPDPASGVVPGVLKGIDGAVSGLLHGKQGSGGASARPPVQAPAQHHGVLSLLDYLLKP